MTKEEAQWLLDNIKGSPRVFVRPSQDRKHTRHVPVFLMGLAGERAIVKPPGHGKEEIVPVDQLQKWKAQTPQDLPPMPDFKEAEKPLSTNLGRLMEKEIEKKRAHILGPGKPKEEYFGKKYTDGQWDEARKLRRLGKSWEDISTITKINRPYLYYKIGKEFSRPHKPKAAKAETPKTPEPVPTIAPVAAAPIPIIPVLNTQVASLDGEKMQAIRQVLGMNLSFKSKCLMIEGLVSHD